MIALRCKNHDRVKAEGVSQEKADVSVCQVKSTMPFRPISGVSCRKEKVQPSLENPHIARHKYK